MIEQPTLAPSNHAGSSRASARRATVGITLLALAWAGILTGLHGLGTARPLLSVVALTLLVAAAIVIVRASDPLRAPFGARAHASVHAMLVAGGFSGAGADWGTDAFARENWVPTALGLLVVAMSAYRPTRELVGYTMVSGSLLGVAVLIGVGPSVSPLPPSVFALTAITPTFALVLGAAVYSREIDKAVQERRRADGSVSRLSDEVEKGIARSVRRSRMAFLGGDVSPFLRQLVGAGRITENDRVRARGIADSLRRALVDEADRTWLDDLVAPGIGGPVAGRTDGARRSHSPRATRMRSRRPQPLRVLDPDRVAMQMTRHQRTALRALIGVIEEGGAGVLSSSLVLGRGTPGGDLGAGGHRESHHAVLSVVVGGDPARTRRQLAPYLSAMEGAFAGFDIESTRNDVIVRFSYDQI